MRTPNNSFGRRLLLPALLLVLILSACGPSNANVTPTLSVDAIFTAAFQTLQAQEATQLALTPPTSTPSPSPFPSLPPPSPLATLPFASSTPFGGGASVCDNSAYVSDVTIPDGTTLKPGEKFTKTWALYNSGTCAWTTSYKMAFVSGDAMGGATTVLAVAVPAGSQGNVSVAMTAPTSNGTYKGNWRLQNASGQPFGNVVYVEIKVGAGSTVTPGPSPTSGPSPTGGAGNVTISGTVDPGGDGVTITYAGTGGSTSGTTVTAADGTYSFVVAKGWSGTVTPSKGSGANAWTFVPASTPLTNVQGNTTLDFAGTPASP